jgi:hypothetical protein
MALNNPPSADEDESLAVALFDGRAFFAKALVYGVQHGILHPDKLEAMCVEAPKGMVQIARYFGSEYLRPEVEKAKDRLVNLVSLHLESSTGGDLKRAAESLRDHSLLSRSKGGSDMLKALITMPTSSHFGMNDGVGFSDDLIPQLSKWTLRSLPDYQAELARRSQVAEIVDAAVWLADALGMDEPELEEAGKDAEAVIRTALLMLSAKRTEMPDWVAFEKLILALRKKAVPVTLPKNLPQEFKTVVELVRQSVVADLPKILDATLPARKLFDKTPAFMGRYFWVEDALAEVDHFDRAASSAWNKATGGHGDDSSLLTLFLTVATGGPAKTVLTEKSATSLIRKIRKVSKDKVAGIDPALKPELASQYIIDHAPEQHQDDYTRLWQSFIEEALPTLQSDFDYELKDALALLRRECNVKLT